MDTNPEKSYKMPRRDETKSPFYRKYKTKKERQKSKPPTYRGDKVLVNWYNPPFLQRLLNQRQKRKQARQGNRLVK